MSEIAITSLATLLVGLVIGWSGVAGFLLPVLFLDYNGMGSNESLFLAFLCFLCGGIIGSLRYRKEGLLDAKSLMPLAISSLGGALLGAMINSFFNENTVKIVLYAVVLVSGLSILLKPLFEKKKAVEEGKTPSKIAQVATGFPVALICALTGAGGPVILMPLLILQKMDAKRAVAAALYDSIFIAIPSVAVYGMGMEAPRIEIMLPSVLLHAVGVYVASSCQGLIRAGVLKTGIAIFSIVFALVMFLEGFL